jgi:hypothetical protein
MAYKNKHARLVYEFGRPGDFPVRVYVSKWDGDHEATEFAVSYGSQLRTGLCYADAAAEFGECVFHALQCSGNLSKPEKE